MAQNGVCFLQQDEALDSHRKLSTYFADVSFYRAAIPTYYGGIMTFARATDNDVLRHLYRDRAGPLPPCRTPVPVLQPGDPHRSLCVASISARRAVLKGGELIEKLKLHGFNNLTKSLSFCIYDICYAKTAEERDGYIAYIDELYNANRLTEILTETCSIIGANILNIARRDYEPQGASVTILVSEEPVDPKLIDKTEHPGPLPEVVVAHR